MSQKSSSKSSKPDVIAISLLETMARKSLQKFLEMFRRDWAAKLDFTKSIEFLDAEAPLYVPEAQLKQENSFTLFVKATSITGEPCRFIIHTIWMSFEQIAVGIADVPDSVVNGFYIPANKN